MNFSGRHDSDRKFFIHLFKTMYSPGWRDHFEVDRKILRCFTMQIEINLKVRHESTFVDVIL